MTCPEGWTGATLGDTLARAQREAGQDDATFAAALVLTRRRFLLLRDEGGTPTPAEVTTLAAGLGAGWSENGIRLLRVGAWRAR